MQRIRRNDFYRLKAQELSLTLQEAERLIIKHNLSRGLIAEEILRSFLCGILPHGVKVSQGFVLYDNICSGQCDIILYDHIHYAPLYSYGGIEVLPSESVIAVIEVKTKIDRIGFEKTLQSFQLLNQLRVQHKYLFIFDGCQITTLQSYFLGVKESKTELLVGRKLYDFDDIPELPDAIISISEQKERNYYLHINDTIDTGTGNAVGYISYEIKDMQDESISSIQLFIEQLLGLIQTLPENDFLSPFNISNNCSDIDINSLNDMVIKGGFPLYDY